MLKLKLLFSKWDGLWSFSYNESEAEPHIVSILNNNFEYLINDLEDYTSGEWEIGAIIDDYLELSEEGIVDLDEYPDYETEDEVLDFLSNEIEEFKSIGDIQTNDIKNKTLDFLNELNISNENIEIFVGLED